MDGHALPSEDTGLDLEVSEQSRAFAGPLWWRGRLGRRGAGSQDAGEPLRIVG